MTLSVIGRQNKVIMFLCLVVEKNKWILLYRSDDGQRFTGRFRAIFNLFNLIKKPDQIRLDPYLLGQNSRYITHPFIIAYQSFSLLQYLQYTCQHSLKLLCDSCILAHKVCFGDLRANKFNAKKRILFWRNDSAWCSETRY
jgi:hypothetical protein